MGDFRASIKIEFSMGDHRAKQDWWINWTPDDTYEGVDARVVLWLSEQAEIGSRRIKEAIYEAQHEAREREREITERAEYERLKKKFEAGDDNA